MVGAHYSSFSLYIFIFILFTAYSRPDHYIFLIYLTQVQFAGNIKRVGSEQSDGDKMMFQPNRDNFKIFNLQLVNPKHPPIGRIKISLIEEIAQESIRVVENINCTSCMKTKHLIPREPIIDYFDLKALPVELNPFPSGKLHVLANIPCSNLNKYIHWT